MRKEMFRLKQHIRKLIIVVLALVFVLSAAMTAIRTVQYRSADQAAQDAQDMVGLIKPLTSPDPLAEDSYAKILFGLDFSSLTAINDEVIGWILVPGTELSQPILKGIDNQYYLSHNWRNEYNPSGAVFMEELCTPDFSDFNTILYAHRMNNDSMFGFLKFYQNEEYLQEHPFLYVATCDGMVFQYEVFAAYEAPVTSDTFRVCITQEKHKQGFLESCLDMNTVDTGIVPTTKDSILTLSTCTGRGHASRCIVQARLVSKSANPEH